MGEARMEVLVTLAMILAALAALAVLIHIGTKL